MNVLSVILSVKYCFKNNNKPSIKIQTSLNNYIFDDFDRIDYHF